MNRKIEFNAWIPELGFMIEDVTYGHGQIGFPSDDEAFNDALISKGFNADEYELPEWLYDTGEDWYYITDEKVYTLLQFAGIKDRNGIEIFEGDILKCDFSHDNNGMHDSIQVVEFYEGSFGSRNKGDHFRIPALFSGRATEGMNLNYYEVIGNIYENCDLIK